LVKRAISPFFILLKQIMGKQKKQRTKNSQQNSPSGFTGAGEKRKTIPKIWQLAEPLCAAEGVDLIHIEYQRESGGRILRLYIEKPGGVNIDDCTAINQQLSDLLDIKLETDTAYTLEVSSPGPERPLSRASDFERFSGYTAKIRVSRPINGQKNFTGILAGYSDETIWLRIDDEILGISHSQIIKARLVNYI